MPESPTPLSPRAAITTPPVTTTTNLLCLLAENYTFNPAGRPSLVSIPKEGLRGFKPTTHQNIPRCYSCAPSRGPAPSLPRWCAAHRPIALHPQRTWDIPVTCFSKPQEPQNRISPCWNRSAVFLGEASICRGCIPPFVVCSTLQYLLPFSPPLPRSKPHARFHMCVMSAPYSSPIGLKEIHDRAITGPGMADETHCRADAYCRDEHQLLFLLSAAASAATAYVWRR